MHVFLCNTQMQVLLALIVSAELSKGSRKTFVILEYSRGVHAFAQRMLRNTDCRLVLLPGRADATGKFERTLIQRANARKLRRDFTDTEGTFYIFHDLLPESQALLNLPNRNHTLRTFVLLEDGVALYGPRGTLRTDTLYKLTYKVAFGMKWKHANAMGLHPNISEIRCLYPQLAHPDLRHQTIKLLPHTLPTNIRDFLHADPAIHDDNAVIIALPYTDTTKMELYDAYLKCCITFCTNRSATPYFKAHPRDTIYLSRIKQYIHDPKLLPQNIPMEAIVLSLRSACTLIGFRTSSLHVIKALAPETSCFYFEMDESEMGQKWITFMENAGIVRLCAD